MLWVSANTKDVPPVITGRVEELALFLMKPKAGVHPDVIRENDAHEALQVMNEVFHATRR
jgi:hypothetical protein